jgi:hypothetical protein
VIGALIGIVMAFLIPNTLAMVIALAFNGFLLALACFQIYIFGYMSD